MTKQLFVFGTAVMTTLLALVVMWQFRIIVIEVMISLTLAAALRPMFIRLVRCGFVVRMAWILLFLVTLGSFSFLLFLTGKIAIYEIQQLTHTVSVSDEWILPLWFEGSSFQQALVAKLPPPSKLFEAFTGDQGQLVLPAIIGFSQGIGGVVSGVFVILILSIYWSINQVHFERLWLSLLPSGQRKQARDTWRVVEPDIGAYIRNEVFHSLLAGLILGFGYWLLGFPYPTLLALVGALASLIPVVGVVLVVIPVLIVGLLASVQISLFSAFYALVVLVALAVWVKPRLSKRRWENPILTVVLLIALANVFGLFGIIFAPLFSVLCQILWRHLVSHRGVAGAAAQVSDLKERQALVWAAIRVMEEPHPKLVTSSMERLTLLIERAEPILKTNLPPGSSDIFTAPQYDTQEAGLPVSTKS